METLPVRPGRLIRLEGAAGCVLALILYERQHGGWLLFIVLILAPDLAIVGYLAGTRIGAACYNAVHTLVLPAALAGYGLKYPEGFKDTHLQRL